MSEDKFCPECGAPMDGRVCAFCGCRAEERARTAEEENVQTAGCGADFLIDKADFLDAETQAKLGLMYLNGMGVAKNPGKAAELFYKAALGGSKEGMFRYAEALKNGAGVDCDEKRALGFYVQAARMGHPAARNVLRERTDGELDVVPDERVGVAAKSEFEAVVNRVRPFCVEFTCFEGKTPRSQGSGCVLSGGLVLTNAHVISSIEGGTARPYDGLYVNFDEKYDKARYSVKPIGLDVNEDVALCAFDGEAPLIAGEPPKLAAGAELTVGKEVFTIGNGLGRGLGLSKGVISRDVERNAYGHSEVVRTDMSVNPGNSGGALFDMDGDILGIMTFVATQRDNSLAYGMSYAVTSDAIVRLLKHALGE